MSVPTDAAGLFGPKASSGGPHPGRRLLLWLLPLAFLIAFFFLPLARILGLGLEWAAMTPANISLVAETLGFTAYQALLSTVLTLAIGLPAASLFAYFEFPGKRLLHALTAVPFMLPTVVVAAGFSALLGPRGWINLALEGALRLPGPPIPFVGTLAAILLAHVFYNTTIVIRLVGGALSHLDPRLSHSAATLGASPTRAWWNVVTPLIRPALISAALLVFLFDFTSFGVILLLGGPSFATLEVQIFYQALQLFDLPLAALLSVIQLACTVALSILYTSVSSRAALPTMPRAADANLRKPGNFPQRAFIALTVLALLALIILPLFALPFRSVARLEVDRGDRGEPIGGMTTAYYRELFKNRQGSIFYVPPAQAAANSLLFAAATVAFSLLMGLPAAYALAHPGPLEKLVDPLLVLPLGAPAVTLGLGFIITFGKWLASPWLVPAAHTIVALPFVIRALQPALSTLPLQLRWAATSLGASPWQAWLTVDWPILRRAVLSAAGFAFTISLGEFGATSLLARPEYPTIPVAIYRFLSQPGGLNYGQAMAMATVLMLLTTIGILVIEAARAPGTAEF